MDLGKDWFSCFLGEEQNPGGSHSAKIPGKERKRLKTVVYNREMWPTKQNSSGMLTPIQADNQQFISSGFPNTI